MANPANTDIIECTLVSDKNCVQNPTVKSNAIALRVYNPSALAKALGPLSFCEGDNVLLEANQGTSFIYQWLKNNNIITGATKSTFTALTSGKYKVSVTDSGCTALSNEIIIDVANKPHPIIKVTGTEDLCQAPSIYLHVAEELGHAYQWRLDSMPLFSANSYYHDASDPGMYSVMVTNKCGTSISDGYSITACITGGIPKEGEAFVKFFPNPTNGRLTVELHHFDNKEAQIQVINHLGQVVIKKEKQVVEGKLIQDLNLGNGLAAGIYTLRVKSGDFLYNTRVILTN
jgi:hypothetical protein